MPCNSDIRIEVLNGHLEMQSMATENFCLGNLSYFRPCENDAERRKDLLCNVFW